MAAATATTSARRAPPAPQRTASRLFLIVVAVAYLFWGTAQTLSLKWADHLSASDGFSFVRNALAGLPYPFEASPSEDGAAEQLEMEVSLLYSFAHPFTQTFFMFCSETLCIFVFLGNIVYKKYVAGSLFRSGEQARGGDGSKCKKSAGRALVPGEDVSLPLNPCVFLLPCGADLLATIIQNIGMMLTYASVYQMLRGATVVWIAVISYFWLHRRFTKVERWGMASVVLGLSLVGLSAILKTKSAESDSSASVAAKNPLVGNLLIVSAQVLHAYQGVCQERLMRLYKIPPLQMVGVEGIYGIGLTLVLLAFLQMVPMSAWGHNLVGVQERLVPSPAGRGAMIGVSGSTTISHNTSWIARGLVSSGQGFRVPYDDVILAFSQMTTSRACLGSMLMYIPAGFFYNACQLTIIKHLSAAATVMLGSLRNITVWAACLMMPSIFGETFSFVQLLGFLALVLGNVLFQRVWITSFAQILPASVLATFPALFVDAPASAPEPAAEVTVEADDGASLTPAGALACDAYDNAAERGK